MRSRLRRKEEAPGNGLFTFTGLMTVISVQVREPSLAVGLARFLLFSLTGLHPGLACWFLMDSVFPAQARHHGALPARLLCQPCLWREPLSVLQNLNWEVSAAGARWEPGSLSQSLSLSSRALPCPLGTRMGTSVPAADPWPVGLLLECVCLYPGGFSKDAIFCSDGAGFSMEGQAHDSSSSGRVTGGAGVPAP